VVTFVDGPNQLTVPSWVTDLDAFRQWADSDDFPETGRICYLMGEVWIDMSKQQIFSHVHVKTEYTVVVGGLVKSEEMGLYLTDGVLFSNVPADISVVPDSLFLCSETLKTGRARLIEGAEAGYVEIEGGADMILEIVSDSSVVKDTETLRKAYWEAGVAEYWLVDARVAPATFEILRHAARGYTSTRAQSGWLKSAVFGKSFRLKQTTSSLGHPAFSLQMRD
jgi:hypothetical protein